MIQLLKLSAVCESIQRPKPLIVQVPCPVCGGSLIQQGNHAQCVRCAFTICDGCEGSSPEE